VGECVVKLAFEQRHVYKMTEKNSLIIPDYRNIMTP